MANEIITQGVEVGSFYDPDTGDVAQTNHIVADSFLFRQRAIENDEQDATGGRYYGGDFSELEYEFVDPDGSLYTMLKGWQEANKRVSFVGAGINRNVQWYERDRLSQVRKVDLQGSVTEGRGDKVFVRMQREGHGSHNIYSNVNLLHGPLGWADGDGDGVPDGYTTPVAWNSTAFSSDVFTGTDDVDGQLAGEIVFPIQGIDLTASFRNDKLHGSGSHRHRFFADDYSDTILKSNDSGFSSTGRKSVDLLDTPANTYGITYRLELSNASTSDTVEWALPAIRVDGIGQYVSY